MTMNTPVAVWRLRAKADQRNTHARSAMVLWVSKEGPQLVEVHNNGAYRPVVKTLPAPSTRVAADRFIEEFPDDSSAVAWNVDVPGEFDASGDSLSEVIVRPVDYQWSPHRAAERVVEMRPGADDGGLVRGIGAAVSPASEAVQLYGGREYWPRPVGGDTTDVELVRAARGQLGTRIKGRPGNGKTTLAEAAFGDDLIVVQGHGDLMKDDLVGRYLPDRDTGGFSWHDGALTRAMREGKVLLFDEVTRAPSDTVNVILSATDDRRVLVLDDRPDLEPVHAADGFHVVITYNEFGVGVRPLDEAVVRRFPLELEATTDYALTDHLGVDDKLITIARRLERLNQQAQHEGGFGIWVPQTGHLLQAQRALSLMGLRVAAGVLVAACTEAQDRRTVAEVICEVLGVENAELRQEPMR